MDKQKYKTISIRLDRVEQLESSVLEISKKTGQLVRWTEIVNFLIDNELNSAVEKIVDVKSKQSLKKIGNYPSEMINQALLHKTKL